MKHYLQLSQFLSLEIIFLSILNDDDFFILQILAVLGLNSVTDRGDASRIFIILMQGPQRALVVLSNGTVSGQTHIVITALVIVQILVATDGKVHIGIALAELTYGPCRFGLSIEANVGLARVGIDILA